MQMNRILIENANRSLGKSRDRALSQFIPPSSSREIEWNRIASRPADLATARKYRSMENVVLWRKRSRAELRAKTLTRGNDWRNGTSGKFRESTMLRDDKSSGGSSSKRPWNFRLAIQNGHKRGYPEAPGRREASRAENTLVEGEAGWRILQGEQIYVLG